ncbi:anthrax toxin receptor-like [Capricornis sumatraensis]|uniref:anthrax toxin receptor-like n=1 Tax=Capricornis sumatraensis TaxID=34865 RepID=UPI0036048C0E
MPGPTLFLLLVLPPPLLSLGSFQHSGPGWKDLHHLSLDWGKLYRHLIQNSESFQHRQGPSTWHRKSRAREDKNSCHSSFDLYFILDMSGSVNNNWMNIYSFVEDLVKKFENPNLRMSFITFSTEGHTVMKLTSDRPRRPLILSSQPSSLFLELAHCEDSWDLEEQADKARQMGATVYCVGVKNFEEHQLMEIADSPYHVFAVSQGFKALKDIVDPLETKSCIEITSVEPSDICVGDEYELMISGKGFNNAKNEDEVICRFKFKDKLIDEKASSVKDTSVICPGIKIESPDEAFSLEISLNNGISFINNDVSLTSKDCASTRAGGPATDTTTPSAPSAAAQPPPEMPPAPPAPPAQVIPYVNPLYLFALIPALLLLSLMFCCVWWLCHRRTVKEPPPVLNPERGEGLGGVGLWGTEEEGESYLASSCEREAASEDGSPDTGNGEAGEDKPEAGEHGERSWNAGALPVRLAVLVTGQEPVGLMARGTRLSTGLVFQAGKCVNFALMRPHCGPLHCSPKACVQPSRECFTINNCCSRFQHSPSTCSRPPSRMQPFISTPARTANRATLSLQPP